MSLNYKLTYGQLLEELNKVMPDEEFERFCYSERDSTTYADEDMTRINEMIVSYSSDVEHYISEKTTDLRNEIYEYLLSVSPVTDNFTARIRDFAQKKVEAGNEDYRTILQLVEQ